MKLKVTDVASQCLIKQLGLKTGDGVRFFGKTVKPKHVQHTPFQGYEKDPAKDPVAEIIKDGINYHVNFADSWFFSGLTTTVDYDTQQHQITFSFVNANGENPDAVTGASSQFEDYWE